MENNKTKENDELEENARNDLIWLIARVSCNSYIGMRNEIIHGYSGFDNPYPAEEIIKFTRKWKLADFVLPPIEMLEIASENYRIFRELKCSEKKEIREIIHDFIVKELKKTPLLFVTDIKIQEVINAVIARRTPK